MRCLSYVLAVTRLLFICGWNIFIFNVIFVAVMRKCQFVLAYNTNTWYSLFMQSGIPPRPCGQADIPEWIGKPSSPYDDDPRILRFLGEPILLPGSTEDPDGASIGKGRQDDCNCESPGSIDCVRFHVAEKKIKLKHELGSAYFEMGFHRIGEDLALTWTKDEERKFNTTIQDSLPSSTNKFWDKLLAVLHDKGREGLVRYYHNVFQVWRRAYQNRLAQNPDSDDDSIEPGFLYIRQRIMCSGSSRKRSRSKSAGSSRKRRRS